ncbi:MAG TPA: ABC transporter ATP-binding protein [Vicinamibacterales bacterium]|nr:ABC transporter ATP-binding protein [Vicinamibacterales bacterium]
MNRETPVLIVDHLSKHYATPRGPLAILDDVSFTLEPGQSLAVMGPSGSGKSTLLYTLGVLEPPTSGTVTINAQNPFDLGEREQAAFRGRTIGFVFQDHLLLPQLSALDNVLVPTLATRPASPAELVARARQLLGDVGLGARLDHRPGELSGGERQRVAIARALVHRPALVLCDEPTGNLDRTAAEAVADLLVALHTEQQTMLVAVTHSPTFAARFGRRTEIADRRLHDIP